jgi:hypothetical protein
MKKTHLVIYAILLVGLLVFSAAQSVSAIRVGTAVFCPNAFYDPPDTQYEVDLSNAYCNAINSMLTTKYSDYCYVDLDTTVNDYTSRLQSLQNLCDKIVVFSKGHRGLPYYPNTNHISLIDHNYANTIDNDHIYARTSAAKNVFTFIWHCETAEKYVTGTIPQDGYGYYGMPYCWTHDQYMDPFGQSGSHVFIGWIDESPQFETPINAQYRFAQVAFWFWYNVCNNGDNVLWSLNHLATRIWGVAYFTDTELVYQTDDHGPIKVWGNTLMYLPSE